MNINSVKAYILSSATNEELNEIIGAIKVAREMMSNQKRRTLKVGQDVKFTSRAGVNYSGKITDIKIKRATVQIDGLPYSVPLSMLKAA